MSPFYSCPMMYLDYSKMPEFLAEHFGERRSDRLAGVQRRYDSGYHSVVRFFGPDRVDPSDIAVNYLNTPWSLADPIISEYAEEMEKRFRAEGRLYDGPPAMKLAACDLETSPRSITVQPVNYGLQAATCFALDHPHKLFEAYGGTLRDYYRRDRTTLSVTDNPLAICLGVCAYVIVEERGRAYLVQVKRSGHLASLENSLGPTVAGVVDYVQGYTNLTALTLASLTSEISEEIDMRRAEYKIVSLGWGLEIFRGERPQIFCVVRTGLERMELAERLEAIAPANREFDSYEFHRLYGGALVDRKIFDSLNVEARMNYLLLEEYLSL